MKTDINVTNHFQDLFNTDNWKDKFSFINDQFPYANGMQAAYRYLGNSIISSLVRDIAEKDECFWFIDTAVLYSKMQFKDEYFIVWRLIKENGQVYVIADDGDYNVIYAHKLEYSDFSTDKDNVILELYYENDTLLLPAER